MGVSWCQLCRSVPRAQHPVQHTLTHVDTSSHVQTQAHTCTGLLVRAAAAHTSTCALVCEQTPVHTGARS